MARVTRKQLLKQDDLAESAADVTHWLEENWQLVAKVAAGVAAVAILIGAGVWYLRHNRELAQQLVAQGTARFESAQDRGFSSREDLEEALQRFDEAISKAGSSPAGGVARYLKAATLHRLGRADEALPELERLAAESNVAGTLAASARALMATVLADQGDTERSMELLRELAEEGTSAFPPAQALLQLGSLHMSRGEQDEARRVWQRIADEYPQSPAAGEATRLLGS